MNAFTRAEAALVNTGHNELDYDQVQKLAPSVFTRKAHPEVSERYAYIPTAAPMVALAENGFGVVQAFQKRTRNAENAPYMKHLIRFRRKEDIEKGKVVGGTVTDILLTNAHKSGAFVLVAGMFRFICSNGMVVGDETMKFRVLHKGNAELLRDKVVEAAYHLVDQFGRIEEYKERMWSQLLSDVDRLELATRALGLRFGEKPPVTAGQILEARRYEDDTGSVWGVYNVVQENLIRGGIPSAVPGRRKTRSVTNIDRDIKLNQDLFNLALEYVS